MLMVLTDSPMERALAWSHLQAAGYITGSYPDGATAPTVALNAYDCPVTTCPDNGFGQGMVVNRGALQQSAGATAPLRMNYLRVEQFRQMC